MPIGLQMIGRRGGDSELLMLAGQAAGALDPVARPRPKEE
jgi:Asp-tRNA(Asn)/Glu-tRNA(Gln) amidotransferase A subunit family amidase